MPAANFSDERRATALRCLRDPETRAGFDALPYAARLLYAVGLLICNDVGVIPYADVDTAMADPSVVQAGRALFREARP